ncbi:uncharacterized protein CDAR_421871 [Caerostris darwini]|uniref:Uncharacterized protein n=1 Tax=Caerostris darwini TaxID=1538125 RepID=A0AAV4VC48_9ARAC|nr:uncharacterized protein CDAR_421871 [Caerostris darwini]
MADWNIRSNKWPEDTTVTEERNLSYFWRRNQKSKKKEEEEKKMPLPFLSSAHVQKRKGGFFSPRRMPLCAQSSIRHVTRYYSCSDGQGRRFLGGLSCLVSHGASAVQRSLASLFFDVPLE